MKNQLLNILSILFLSNIVLGQEGAFCGVDAMFPVENVVIQEEVSIS